MSDLKIFWLKSTFILYKTVLVSVSYVKVRHTLTAFYSRAVVLLLLVHCLLNSGAHVFHRLIQGKPKNLLICNLRALSLAIRYVKSSSGHLSILFFSNYYPEPKCSCLKPQCTIDR